MDSTKKLSLPSGRQLYSGPSILIICMLPTMSLAADFGAGISVGVSLTDNVLLESSPNGTDDLILQASPFLTFDHKSPNFDAKARYTFDLFRYRDLNTTSRYHRGDVSLTGKAWQESLLMEIGAQRSQVLGDPGGVIPPDKMHLSGNLLDQDEWWFNPRYTRSFADAVTLDADYRYSEIEFHDASGFQTQDNTNHSGIFRLENYVVNQGLTWALRYEWRRTEYELSAQWEYQQATAEIGFWVNKDIRLFTAGGKESAWDNPLDPSLTDPFWEAGFATAGERLTAEFAAGERSFGSSWRGEIDYKFRRGHTSASYVESPTTTGFNQGGGIDDVLNVDNELDAGEFDDFLDRPGSAERFILKRFQWDLNLEFRRTGFGIEVFDEDRIGRTRADGTMLTDQSQTGATMRFSWQAGIRTEFTASGSYIDQTVEAGNEAEFKQARLGVEYRLGERSDLTLDYVYNEQDPSELNSRSQEYVANIVSLIFTYSM